MKRLTFFSTTLLVLTGFLYQAPVNSVQAEPLPSNTVNAEEQPGFWTTPTIHNYGKIHRLDHGAYKPDPRQTYKIIFMLTHGGKDPSRVNIGLDHVARTVNLYTAAGVPLSHLKIVAVISGKATSLVLKNDAYRAHYKVDNPNLPLIASLRQAGVDVTVCGQAMPENHFDYSQISKDVTLSYSSLLTVSTLEHQGYGFMPF